MPHTRVLEVLHNPAYAGTYVYGRPQTRTQVLPGEAPRVGSGLIQAFSNSLPQDDGANRQRRLIGRSFVPFVDSRTFD